ncbi:MAG: RNA polymerase sigma factor [Planctomycetota bacterium]
MTSIAFAQRLRDREPAALERFFELYFDRLYAFVRRSVGAEHLAEDLVQEVFLRIHRALPSYDPARALDPWVFRIAANRLRDYWRSREYRATSRASQVEPSWFADHAPVAEDEPLSERDEILVRLRAAVDGLPEVSRVVVQLRGFEGLSFDSIARIVGRSEAAVRKRYSRALAALRASLGGARLPIPA